MQLIKNAVLNRKSFETINALLQLPKSKNSVEHNKKRITFKTNNSLVTKDSKVIKTSQKREFNYIYNFLL